MATDDFTIRPLQDSDVTALAEAFAGYDSNKNEARFRKLLDVQEIGLQSVWLAMLDDQIAGYVTVIWQPELSEFATRHIPEISDLNILPGYRRQGIANRLLDKVEAIIASRSPIIGIGVGMTADYAAAQSLYIARGYRPFGNGLTYKYQPLAHGQQTTMDDDLVFWLTKDVRQ